MFEVVEELRACGVELITVADGFSLDGPAAEVIIAVLAWASRMERLAINERIASARLRIEAEGGTWGRPRRGHTKSDKRYHVKPLDVAKVLRLRRAGRTYRQIAHAMGEPLSTVADSPRRAAGARR